MTAILRQLPFREQADEVSCGLERIPIKPYQIIVWVSVTVQKAIDLEPQTPRIPAILDTGHGHNFAIQQHHLEEWARIPMNSLRQLGATTTAGHRLSLHAANVWLHPNVPGQRDQIGDQRPFLLALEQGIAVAPRELSFPRLPLLGLRALVRNKLHLTLDSERCLVNLRGPSWRTQLLRWLS